jgi:hypothetical protein
MMYDTRQPDFLFGDEEARSVLASPYQKTISWNLENTDDFLSVYYKSTRADVDIGALVLQCKGQNCIEGSVDTLVHWFINSVTYFFKQHDELHSEKVILFFASNYSGHRA